MIHPTSREGADTPSCRDEAVFQKVIETFRGMEVNSDRRISHAELARVLQLLDPQTFTEESVKVLVAGYETDNDGRFDLDGFIDWIATDKRSAPDLDLDRQRQPQVFRDRSASCLPGCVGMELGEKIPMEPILAGYSHLRRDLEVVVRSAEADLRFARTLSAKLRTLGLKSKAAAGMDAESDELTVWVVTSTWAKKSEEVLLKAAFDRSKAIVIYPSGVKHSVFTSELLTEGLQGPSVEIGMSYDGLARTEAEDISLKSMQWMARIWTKLVVLQGVRYFQRESDLCRAVYSLVMDPEHALTDRGCTTPDGTPLIVGFIGSTFLGHGSGWTLRLAKHVAVELMRLNRREVHKEIVICTGGFRNMKDIDSANQGAGYTISQEYHKLGGCCFHILPEVANEKDYSANAIQLADNSFLPCDHGVTLFAGKSNDDRLNVMAGICDIMFLIEGGPGAAAQAKAALAHKGDKITVVPIRASGGAASCKKFGMPEISKPMHINAKAWAKVSEYDIVQEEEPGAGQKNMTEEEIVELAIAMASITRSTIYPLDALVELHAETGSKDLTAQHPQWIRAATEEVKKQISYEGGAKICILGSVKFNNSTSEDLVKALARCLNEAVPNKKALFLTGGMPGVQDTFAKHCGDASRVWNLVPLDTASVSGVGRDVHIGANHEDKKLVFGAVGDIYITVEGGPGVSQEANDAAARGAYVLPLRRSGGASKGMFGFPKTALQKPHYISEEQWELLGNDAVPVEDSAAAASQIILRIIDHIFPATQPALMRRESSASPQVVRTVSASQIVCAHTATLKTHLLEGTHVCILGSTSFENKDSEALVKAVASELDASLNSRAKCKFADKCTRKNPDHFKEESHPGDADWDASTWGRVAFITGGLPGVQETFARHSGEGGRVWNLIPGDQGSSGFEKGRDYQVGDGQAQHSQVFSAVGHIYITVEGGESVADEARKAWLRGAVVLPFARTGGASSGMFDFPEAALKKPRGVQEDLWSKLQSTEVSVEESARAGVQIILSLIAERKQSAEVPHHVRIPDWQLPTDKFISPTEFIQMDRLSVFLELLKLSEKSFRTYGRFSNAEVSYTVQILTSIRTFLLHFKRRSNNSKHIHFMKAEYVACGSKFARVYSTIVEDVIKTEPAHKLFLDAVGTEKKVIFGEQRANSQCSDGVGYDLLFQVYRDADENQGRLATFCKHIAATSGVLFVEAPLKRMWRSMEKLVFKYGGEDDAIHRGAAELKDVSRAALQGTMEQLLEAFKAIVADENACIVRIKNRFAKPTDMGWADCQLMLYFSDTDHKHICEIQLVHNQLMIVRSAMGAHKMYTRVRAASELLTAYGEEVPSLNEDVRQGTRAMLTACRVSPDFKVTFPPQFAAERKPARRSLADLQREASGDDLLQTVLGDATGDAQAMAMVFGVADESLLNGGRISLRWENEEFIVFDDHRCHAPLHLVVMPTAWRIPDWTYLLAKPALAVEIIRKMRQATASAIAEFLRHEQFRDSFFRAPAQGWPAAIDTEWALKFCMDNALWFFKDPAPRNQLSLHVLLPPIFPWCYPAYLNDITSGNHSSSAFLTLVPLQKLETLLGELSTKSDDGASESLAKDFKAELDTMKSYNESNARITELQQRLSKWRDIFIGMSNRKGAVFTIDDSGCFASSDESAAATHDKDSRLLSAYGKPSQDDTPSGTFYGFPKNFLDVSLEFLDRGSTS